LRHAVESDARFVLPPATAENRGVVVTEAGSYLRLIDSCICQLEAQGPSRTCNERNKEEDEVEAHCGKRRSVRAAPKP